MATSELTAIHVDDAGFVRAPRPLVYRRLTDVAGWPGWWSGLQATRLPAVNNNETWSVRARRDRRRSLDLTISLHSFRHDMGFSMRLAGDVSGTAEYWLEDQGGGTVVHHVLVGETLRPIVAMLTTYRAVQRRGLFGLKDVVQTEVRTAVSLQP